MTSKARINVEKLRDILSVIDFGADPTGVADSTAAFQAAIAARVGATSSSGGGVGSGSFTQIFVPPGFYRIDSAITADTGQALNYFSIVGDDAILNLAAGVVAFGGVGYMAKFQGLTFRGGACAISIKTNNVDTIIIDVDQCEFHNQTTASIRTDAASNSTVLNITRCKFYMSQAAGGYVGYFATGDWVNVDHCWITCNSQVCFHVGAAANLRLKYSVGIPGGALTSAGGRWIDNYHNVAVNNFRFGGESAGAPFVRNYAGTNTTNPIIPNVVKIINCDAYSVSYAVEFYELPNIFTFVNNQGLVDCDGFYFDSSLTGADFAAWQANGQFITDNNFPTDFLNSVGTTGTQKLGETVFLAALVRTGTLKAPATSHFAQAQIFGSGAFGGGWGITATAPNSYVTNDLDVQAFQASPSASGQYFVISKTDFLSPTVLTYGQLYTLVLSIEGLTLTHTDIIIRIGSASHTIVAQKGRRTYCIPFVYLNNTGSANATFDSFSVEAYDLTSGDVMQIGRHVLVEGMVDYRSDILTLRGTAAPTAYTVGTTYNTGYYRGDVSYRTNVAAGGAPGDVCVTTGAPGTWKAMASVAA